MCVCVCAQIKVLQEGVCVQIKVLQEGGCVCVCVCKLRYYRRVCVCVCPSSKVYGRTMLILLYLQE